MLELTTVLGKRKSTSHALANAEAAESFWDSLPRRDPIEMQRRLCTELAKGASLDKLDINRFRALRALDRRTVRLLEGIVAEYAVLGRQSPTLERSLWRAALDLSHSFARDFERFLRAVRTGAAGSALQDRAPELLVRLFQHREIELLLASLRYVKWPRGRWKSLHDDFRFAAANGFTTREVPIARHVDGSISTVTPEQIYIRILLLHLLDGGQFRPEEIAWARRAIVNWSRSLRLRALSAFSHHGDCTQGFTVDLAGTQGLTRINATAGAALLYLDTTPIAHSIDAEIAERGAAAGETSATVLQPGQLGLLGKLQILYAPQPKRIPRRGERTAVTLMSVEAILGGLETIFRGLNEEVQGAIEAAAVSVPCADEITITNVDTVRARGSASASFSVPSARAECDPLPSTWNVRDRSDSGCRLRGRFPDAHRLLPGLLVAFRDDKFGPWTLAVLRRLNRLTGSNVEIGVEYIGRDPRRVILLSRPGSPEAGAASETRPDRFVALYLRESDIGPKIPIKTLLVPACEFVPGRVLTIMSTTREVDIRLKEPLEHQPDFVWTSFEPLDGNTSADCASLAMG